MRVNRSVVSKYPTYVNQLHNYTGPLSGNPVHAAPDAILERDTPTGCVR